MDNPKSMLDKLTNYYDKMLEMKDGGDAGSMRNLAGVVLKFKVMQKGKLLKETAGVFYHSNGLS